MDAPTNEMHTDAFVEVSGQSWCALLYHMMVIMHSLQKVREIGRKLGIQAEVIQGTDLQDKGFGGMWMLWTVNTLLHRHQVLIFLHSHLPSPPLHTHTHTHIHTPPFSQGIYGVGQAAVHPPALAVLSHRPPGAEETICWVGKGIVYDTGGLSIKTKVGLSPCAPHLPPILYCLTLRLYYLTL